MGLAPAGVNLRAQNFKQYINQLNKIEKAQDEVFGTQNKGLSRSYNDATKAARKYEQQASKTAKIQSQLNSTLTGIALGIFSRQTAEVIIESARAAAAFEGQRQGLNNLAASFGQSSDAIRAAMRRASQGVLSESAIIQAANQALLLNVAQTPEQFEEVTQTAIILGRTMGLTATQAIEQFTTALGRRSLLILDNFGISAKAVNAEIERLSQAEFGVPASQLDEAAKNALFMEAALKIAGEAAATIGEESGKATANFDRLSAQTENLKIAFGEAVLPTVGGLAELLGDAAITAQQLLAFITAGVSGVGSIIAQIGGILGDEGLAGLDDIGRNLDQILDEAAQVATERFKDVARAGGIAFPEDIADDATQSIKENTEILELNEEAIRAVENALKRAENLQLSFARAAEDAARKQQRATDKLNRSQFKERVEFLNKQADEFDEFQADEIKSVQEAERKLDDARTKAGADRLREQAKLHRQLKQAEDRFNLTRLQGERRFNLDDRRLRAEGDILGLQELRENFALDQKENEENFDLQQRQTKENGREQEKERDRQRSKQVQALEQELSAIQDSLDQRRDEFLIAQDQEFRDLLNAQQEQRDEAERALREQEEDRRISQQRQLEDLGRSLADQEDLTAEGAARIAEELETVFGMEGVADNIMSGFTARTESEFRDLFENVEDIITSTEERLAQARAASRAGNFGLVGGASGLPVDINRPLAFDDGGVVPGPRGAPQPAIVHGGETVLPTHRMSVPIIPSQNLNVIASGRISVEGSGTIDESALVQVEDRIADSMEIAIRRMARRG